DGVPLSRGHEAATQLRDACGNRGGCCEVRLPEPRRSEARRAPTRRGGVMSVVVLSPADLKSLVKDAVAEALGAKGSVVKTLALRDCGPPVRTLRAAIKAGELSACRVGREYRV